MKFKTPNLYMPGDSEVTLRSSSQDLQSESQRVFRVEMKNRRLQDYAGQKQAEQIFKYVTIAFGIVGFLVGYYNQQLSHSMIILGIGCVIAGLVTLPPWPMYRSDPIKWRKPRPAEESGGTATPASGHKGKSKKKH